MKKISFTTLSNLIQMLVIAILGISALAGAIYYCAWWHYGTAAMCFALARTLYKDKEYGTESVQSYLHRTIFSKK